MQKNIFIVGCPRSGTTFTQSFFAAHPLVYATPETQFFIELIGYQQLQQRLRPHSFIVRSKSALSNFRSHLGLAQHGGADVRREVRFFLRGMQRQDLFERFPRYDPRIRALSGAFLEIIEHLAEDEGKFIWVEKSPNHLFSIESIEDLVPGSMFIHVLRDGRDTVASLKDIAIRYPDSFWRMFADVDRCIQRWNICVETSMRYLGRSNHYLLRYEDLLKDPEAKLRDMCSFLGTQYAPTMLDERTQAARKITYTAEAHKIGVQSKIDAHTNRKFAAQFTPDEQAYIVSSLVSVDWRAVAAANMTTIKMRSAAE